MLLSLWGLAWPPAGWSQTESAIETAALAPVADPKVLLAYLRQALLTPERLPLGVFRPEDADHTMTVAGAGGASGVFASAELVSLAVDTLADTVASDGGYLYAATDPMLDLEVNLGAPTTNGGEAADPDGGGIRVYEILEDPPAAVKVASIARGRAQLPVAGLYLFAGAGAAGEPLLASIASRPHNGWFFWGSSGYWRLRKTEVELFDISTPQHPQTLTRLEFDGQLIAARRIGATVYIVTRFTPALAGPIAYPAAAAASAGLGELMPTYSVDGVPRGRLVEPRDCYLIEPEAPSDARPDWLTVTAIDVAHPQHPVSIGVVGPNDTVHVAADALYLAVRHNDSQRRSSVSGRATDATQDGDGRPEVTEIHKFSLFAQGPEYRGSGTVAGHIDTLAEEKPFAMSEYEQVLRIVTTVPATDEGPSSVRLTLLEETPNADGTPPLVEVGRVDHLEETVAGPFTAGFAGPAGYLASRRPASTIRLLDLARPDQPSLGGEIAVSGGGYRLFPMGEDAIVGIGRQSGIGADGNTDRPPRRWEGIQLLLIDSSDPLAPVLLDSVTIGRRGTESAARLQPQALYAEPPAAASPGRLALPIRLVDIADPDSEARPDAPGGAGDWVHTGLYLFDVTLDGGADRAAGFVARGVLAAATAGDGQLDAWGGLDRGDDRAQIAGEVLHYIHHGEIRSAPWPPPDSVSP